MPIVTDAVFAARNDNGIGFYQRDWLADEHWHLLGTISRDQRSRYRKLDIIPCQVLCVWWDWDFLPHRQKPNQGADMMRLLDHLYEWRYRDAAHAKRGLWLFERIVMEEIMPRPQRKQHRYQHILKGRSRRTSRCEPELADN